MKICKSVQSGLLCFLAVTTLMGCYAGEKTLVPKPPYVPKEIEESYILKFEPKVDIVFVVDDSGSMSSHQRTLADNLNLFTSAMEKNEFLDYHIGVMSTSAQTSYSSSNVVPGLLQGQPQFVTRTTDHGLTLLERNIVALGTRGSATEMVFEPLRAGLLANREQINPGFLRSDAFLVIIFVTDAEDQSEGITGFKVYNDLLRLKAGDENKILGYSVLANPKFFGDSCRQDDSRDDPVLIEHFMSYFTNAYDSKVSSGIGPATTNGSGSGGSGGTITNIFSLCDPMYGEKLANIGEDIRYRVSRSIPLPRLPVRGTIRLKYGSQFVDPKWWKYDPTSQSVLLEPGIELVEEEGAQFSVVMDQSNPDETIGVPVDVDQPFKLEE